MYYDERGNYFDYDNVENNDINDIKDIKTFDYDFDIKNKDYNFDINNKNYDFDVKNKDYTLDVNNINVFNFASARRTEVVTPVEGFNRGNMFNDLYEPYKNHYYKVMVKGERDSLLLNIQILQFALNDLNIYLDLYPKDKECINLFNKYNSELQKYKNAFENKYGPITVDGIKYQNEFTWIKNPWPWDKGGSI